MTDRTQFEQMLEALINEDQQTAKDIFHNIVVAKSREIYEELLESDFSESTMPGQDSESGSDLGIGEEKEEDTEDDFSDKDDTDDQIDDVEADGEDDADSDFGGDTDAEGEGDVEDRVQDLEDALEDLKAEFEQLMAGEEGEEHMGGDDMGDEFGSEEEPAMGGDEFGMDEPEMAEAPGMHDAQTIEVRHSFAEDDEQLIREYVEKVNGGFGAKIGGDNGVQTKSVVAGKNDMGGTVSNIAQGDVEVNADIGAKSTVTGSALSSNKPQDMKTGNINVPGGNAGKTGFKKKEPGHGAEKKGAGETADKSATSTLNGVKTRAK
jgi:hypothetical protein